MTIGAGLFLIAVGAILRFGITTAYTHGVSVHTIGDILMIVGALEWCCGWWCGRRGPGAGVRPTGRRRPTKSTRRCYTRRYPGDGPY